jgi:plasmid stabilization system protein ParE
MGVIRLTDRAHRDLREIEHFSIKEWGQPATEKYLDDIESALLLLSENPGLLKRNDDFSEHLKFYRVNRHFLICDVMGDDITILAIRHGAMDLSRRIWDLEPSLLIEAEMMHRKLQK